MHNYIWYLSRRIALGYRDCKDEDLNRYAYIDNLLVRVKKFGALPESGYKPEDVFVLTEPDFEKRFDEDVRLYLKELTGMFPDDDLVLWEFILFDIASKHKLNESLNGLSGALMKKFIYMKCNAPYIMCDHVDDSLILSIRDITEMTGIQLMGVIYEIEAYDWVYQKYGLGIDYDDTLSSDYGTCVGRCYVMDNDKEVYLPLYGNAYGFTVKPSKE